MRCSYRSPKFINWVILSAPPRNIGGGDDARMRFVHCLCDKYDWQQNVSDFQELGLSNAKLEMGLRM